MKTAFKWFDTSLTVLCVGPLVVIATIFILVLTGYNFPTKVVSISGAIIEFSLLTSLCFGLLYLLAGIILLLVNLKLKSTEKFRFGKSLLVKGIIRSITTVVFLVMLSIALSFIPLPTPVGPCGSALCLPSVTPSPGISSSPSQ